jgi:hypothetical protein
MMSNKGDNRMIPRIARIRSSARLEVGIFIAFSVRSIRGILPDVLRYKGEAIRRREQKILSETFNILINKKLRSDTDPSFIVYFQISLHE